MPRNRTIHPTFPRFTSMARVGREARLLFILLWTVADDAGRLRLAPDHLVDQLFPFDSDALALLPAWLDELEGVGCLERYSIEGTDYLRIRHWRRLQKVQHPSPSHLPAAPHESHESHEELPRMPMGRASKANPHEDLFSEEEAALLSEPGEFTPKRVLGILDLALRKSLMDNVHTAPARYIELAGRHAGLWGGKGAPNGKKQPEQRTKSPGELMREEAAKHGRSGQP